MGCGTARLFKYKRWITRNVRLVSRAVTKGETSTIPGLRLKSRVSRAVLTSKAVARARSPISVVIQLRPRSKYTNVSLVVRAVAKAVAGGGGVKEEGMS